MLNRSNAGGAAMAGGQRYQAQVTAYWAARILLQTTTVGESYNLPAIAIAEQLYCETADSVDDIRIHLTVNGQIFGQCKRSLNLSARERSDWASVLKQFYQELNRPHSAEVERRFVLFYETPNGNLASLGTVLNRYRDLANGASLLEAVTNNAEQRLIDNLILLLNVLSINNAHQEELLRYTYIYQLQFSVGGATYLSVVDALQANLLANPTHAYNALVSLHRLADDLIAERGSVGRLTLRQRLQGQGIMLRDSINYRTDFEQLESLTSRQLATHWEQKRASLIIANRKISIPRTVIQEMLKVAQENSFLVVGEAGTGKTGCLLTLAEQLRVNHRVWYWAADSLPHHSPEEIARNLDLNHRWEDLFRDAVSGSGALLIIDGLDGLRNTEAQRAYRNLIALAVRCGVRVIASIRAFDLEYSLDLQNLFRLEDQPVSAQFSSDRFKKVKHIFIPELDEDELNQVTTHFPEIQIILDVVPQMRPVIRNPFSLNLLCELVAGGETATQFSPISTQAELFELYWNRRVNNHQLRQEIKNALHHLVKQMVEQQCLQVTPGNWETELSNTLFSSSLIRYPQTAIGQVPRTHLVEFNHHLLFDYVAELLFVRSKQDNLASELASDNTWALFLRPSLVLFHRYLWHYRQEFWETLLKLEQSNVPMLQKLPTYLIIAEETRSREDLQRLLDGSLSNNGDKDFWIHVTRSVANVAAFSSLPQLFKAANGDWWIEFARDLIYTNEPQSVYIGRRILFVAGDAPSSLSIQGRSLLNQAALALVKFHWQESLQPNLGIRPAIIWVCSTFASNPLESVEIIQRIISAEELERAGYVQALDVANHINSIGQVNPNLVVEIYDAVFGYIETDRSPTPFVSSALLGMTSNRRQDYELVYHVLSESFSIFLAAHPSEGSQILIRVMQHIREREDPGIKTSSIDTFNWNNNECRWRSDYIYVWDRSAKSEMLQAWEEYLVNLPKDNEAKEKWEAVSNVLATENEIATIWKSLLLATSRVPEFYAERLWTILLNPIILFKPDIHETVEVCLDAFIPYLANEDIGKIEALILGIRTEIWRKYSQTRIEDIEPYISRLAQLLQYIPEAKRSDTTTELLTDFGLQEVHPTQPNNVGRIRWAKRITREIHETDEVSVEAIGNIIISHPNHDRLQEAANFLNKLSANDISDDNLQSLLQQIRDVERLLAQSLNGIDSTFALLIQEKITYGLVQIVSSQANLDQALTNELFARFKQILESILVSPHSEIELASFDQFPFWGTPNPRINATEGVVYLAQKVESLPNEWQSLLRSISADRDPVIRLHLGIRIWSFLDKWPEFVWETLEHWIDELPNRPGTAGVLGGTLRDAWFWWLRNDDEVRVNELLKELWMAAHSGNVTTLRRSCGSWLMGLYLSNDETWANDILGKGLQSVQNYSDELDGALHTTINELFPREGKEFLPVEQQQRGQNFLVRLLNVSKQDLEAYDAMLKNLSPADRPAELPAWVKQVVLFFDQIANQFQFSVVEQENQWLVMRPAERDTHVKIWWEISEPVLEALLNWPNPRAHYSLIKGFDHLISFDIKRSLYWVRKITDAGISGLVTEQLAADETIGILEKILAEYRASLANDNELRSDFLAILEAYLQAGWSRAIQLAIRLESIFR